MAKFLIVLLTGKEDVNREMVAFNFAINSVRNAGATVEFLFLGRGVEAALRDQRDSPQFESMVNQMRELGIPLKICRNSMQSLGVSEDEIFPGIEQVLGGVEVARRSEEGYTVLTF